MADSASTVWRLAGIGRPHAIAIAALLFLALIASVWGTAATRGSTVAHSPAAGAAQSRANASEVARVVLPSDPPSPGWTTFGGWSGLLRTFHLAGPLRWLPQEVGAVAIVLALFGWASWNSPTGPTAILMYLGYGLAFMLFGRANNFYWGLMVTPAFLIGLAFLPQAFADLVSATRVREPAA